MKRNILRGFTMLALIVAMAFVTAVASANGQSRTVAAASIPFEFSVGDKALPAGQYMVKEASSNGNALMIQNKKSAKSAIRLSNSIQAPRESEKTKLVFRRYGPRYFLAEVWVSGESTGHQLRKSKAEKTIESQLAAIFPKGEQANYEIVEVVASLR
ncbi:MAG TPA: hypothetical protein VFH31_01550 [Pyrinomonadaceae bacterium]|nr:hypothetical protein [Pyrinomonadaceae bacterium]